MKLIDIYENHYLPEKTSKRAASTVAGYDSSMRPHVLPRWGECEIEDICPDDMQEWIDSFELAGAAEKAFKCLHQIVRWRVRKKRLHIVDQTTYIELNSRKPYRPDVLDAEEVSEMLRALYGHWTEAAVICAVTLGLRRGEACALEWSDINLKTGEVRINKSRQYINGQIITVETKTEKSTRSCYFKEIVGSDWDYAKMNMVCSNGDAAAQSTIYGVCCAWNNNTKTMGIKLLTTAAAAGAMRLNYTIFAND